MSRPAYEIYRGKKNGETNKTCRGSNLFLRYNKRKKEMGEDGKWCHCRVKKKKIPKSAEKPLCLKTARQQATQESEKNT